MQKIKLIWDFRGPNAGKIAEHHESHIKEYIKIEKINCYLTGIEHLNDMYAIVFMVIVEPDVKPVRDALKPHRGQIYNDN